MSSRNDSPDSYCPSIQDMIAGRRRGLAWLRACHLSLCLGLLVALPLPLPIQAENRALLVGVTKYPGLDAVPGVPKLRGPDNDVNLMRHVLIQRGFKADQIRILSNATKQSVPTRGAILAALDQLATDARNGDQVVVYLSGHGSQQPAEDTPDNLEEDGLDEVFLPTDVQEWRAGDKRIPGAITDNELGLALRGIARTGAYIWFIADTCHSGTLTRGTPGVARQVPVSTLVPESVLSSARSAATVTPRPRAPVGSTGSHSLGWVEMYACQPHELTRELPLGGESDQYHGLFTYCLAQALLNADETISHADLMEQVRAAYRARGIESPSPMLQGVDAHRRVFGSETLAQTSAMSLHYVDGKPRVLGGRLAGLENGSILQVHSWNNHSPAAKAPAYVVVHNASLLEAEVVPCKFNGYPAVSQGQLKEGSRCTLVSNRPPDLSLRLFIASTVPAALWTHLSADPRLQSRISRVDDNENAEWTIEADGPPPEQNLTLHPAWRGVAMNPTNHPPPGQTYRFLPNTSPDSRHSFAPLAEALSRITHATSFLRAIQAPEFHLESPSTLGFSIGMRVRQGESGDQDRDSASGPNGRLFRKGDITTVTITNTGSMPLQLVIFSVDSNFRITRIPLASEHPIRAGQTALSEPLLAVPGGGLMEQIVVIGVRHEDGRVLDFACVEQDPIASDFEGSTRGKAIVPAATGSRTQGAQPRDALIPASPLSHWLGTWQGNSRSQELASKLPEYRVKTLAYRVQ